MDLHSFFGLPRVARKFRNFPWQVASSRPGQGQHRCAAPSTSTCTGLDQTRGRSDPTCSAVWLGKQESCTVTTLGANLLEPGTWAREIALSPAVGREEWMHLDTHVQVVIGYGWSCCLEWLVMIG